MLQPPPPCPASTHLWQIWASGPCLHWQLCIICVCVCVCVCFLPVVLPSEIPELPTDKPVKVFSTMWKLLLHDSLPRTVSIPKFLSLFLSFTFCPTYFWKSWAAFLVPGVLHQLSEVVLWNLLNIQMIFWWISWGRKWSPCLIPLPSRDSHTITAKLSSYKRDHVVHRTENSYYLNLYR